jgi:hypothetical protein
LTLAGLAVGGYAVGGLGLGVVAIAGLALAIYGAFGGAAIAVQYATGGLAIARHSNDDAAQQFMASSWMQAGKQLAQLPAWGWWLVAAVLFLPHVISWWITSRQRSG